MIDFRFQIIQRSNQPCWRRRISQPKPTTARLIATNLPASSRDLPAALSAWRCHSWKGQSRGRGRGGYGPSNPGTDGASPIRHARPTLPMLPKSKQTEGVFLAKNTNRSQNWLGMPRHKKYSLIMNHTFMINICVMDMYILYIHEYVCLLIYILCIPYAFFTQ